MSTSIGIRWKMTVGPVVLLSLVFTGESTRLSLDDVASVALRRSLSVAPQSSHLVVQSVLMRLVTSSTTSTLMHRSGVGSQWNMTSVVPGSGVSWMRSTEVMLIQKPNVAQTMRVKTSVNLLDPKSLLSVLVYVEHEVEIRGFY
jgi:hypothetical protein